jgi:4-cresol dehydrogenase (hydroxylating) flavoprotein subunit
LPGFVDALRKLYQTGLLDSVTHVANHARTRSALEPLVAMELRKQFPEKDAQASLAEASRLLDRQGFGPWSAILPLQGDPVMVRNATRLIKKHLRPFAKVRTLSERRLARAGRIFRPQSPRRAMLNAIEPLAGFAANRPSSAALGSVYQPLGEAPDRALWEEVDTSHAGSLYCLPFFPVDGPFLAEQMKFVENAIEGHGFTPAITANLVDGSAMELVISIAFDKRVPQQVEDAHQCIRELTDHFIRIGCPPYRVGIQSMDQIVDPTSPYWQYIRRLKQVFDPHGIISPGRYNID